MAFTVRGLLAKVAMFRPDKDEATALFAIQEAARSICRYSELAREIQVPVAVLANTQTSTMVPSNSNDLLRVEMIRYAPVPYPSVYKGTWDANANVPILASGGKAAGSTVAAYGFYIVSAAGNTTIDSLTGWGIGDVVYSNGTSWVAIPLENFVTSQQVNKVSTDLIVQTPQEGPNTPDNWSQEGPIVRWYPIPGGDAAIEYTLSYIPSGEFDTIPLPRDAEDCIVAGALEFLCNLPGDGHNPTMAAQNHRIFTVEKENLRSLAMQGYGGDAWNQPANFAGRNTTSYTWVL